MKLSLFILILSSALLIGMIGGNTFQAPRLMAQKAQSVEAIKSANTVQGSVRYRISPGKSRFMAHVGSGGLLWFLGHSHHFAIRDFAGEATITPGSIAPASLEMIVKAASLEETGKNFTQQQKQIITETARKQVLEAAIYPEIIFKSTAITGNVKPDGLYEAKIDGDLTLHGVTRHVELPAQVIVNENTLHASGAFSVNRSDYKVKTESVKGGTIRVRNKVTFEFDIEADKV